MIAYRLFAPGNICRAAIFLAATACFGGALAAEAAAPSDGWQALGGNSNRTADPDEWTPDRNQLRESQMGQAAQDVKQEPKPTANTASPLQRAGNTASTTNAKTAASSPSAAIASNQTAPASDTTTSPRWMLPNQQQPQSANVASQQNSGRDTAPREPRPFVPGPNAARPVSANQPVIPASHVQRTSPAQQPQQTANRPSQNNQITPSAAQQYAMRNNPPSPVGFQGGGAVHAAQPKFAVRQPAPKAHSYSGRLWGVVNTAFQTGDEWGAAVEPEQLPMPKGGYHMGPASGPYMMEGAGGCSDGSCYGGAGCGCGETCGCGDACGCESGCGCGGDGMCGCESGCGCGGACEPGCGCEPTCGCGTCGSKPCCIDGMCIGVGDDQSCHTIRVRVPKWQELSIFAGVHGFKGPYDQNRDGGNFGFHDGINAGFKMPFTSLGYQLGYQAVHSQLNGDENQNISSSHTQHFATVGMFHRAKSGLQGGVAWDVLSDDRFGTHDYHQVRGELSLIDRGCHEFGAAVSFHLNEHEFFQSEEPSVIWRATDQYLLFYRFHAARGGEGRFYGGWTDDSEGIVGSDLLLPLTDRWSLNASFTYLIPDEASGFAGAGQEAWNIATSLVWSWDCRARRSHSNCYRPLFNVANNGTLIVNDRPGSAPLVANGNDGG